MKRAIIIGLAMALPGQANAQAIKPAPVMKHFAEEDIAKVEIPDLSFKPSADDVDAFDKYFYFNRADTSFDQAYFDISECDALASGIAFNVYGGPIPYTYTQTMGGAVGAVIGTAMVAAIFGSAERRRIRRINLRNCMGFKGYQRYGMERERWQGFNFEEGLGRVEGEKREKYLMMQAKVASGVKPQTEVLEP